MSAPGDHARTPLPDDDLVAEYVARALESVEAGALLDLDELCADRLDLCPRVVDALRAHGIAPPPREGAARLDVLAGRVLADRYRLTAPIGRGAAGAVWRARDLRLLRDVAVKLLHSDRFGSPADQARFARDLDILARRPSPHVVRVLDQGRTADGAPFVVTELLHGASLQALLDASRRAMPDGPRAETFARTDLLRELLPTARLESGHLRQVVTWVAELAKGLAHAHGHGVLHRDVRPANAFVRADGTAVLLDFGLPPLLAGAADGGAPHHAAPELVTGTSPPGPAADVYGLCATLHHLLALRPPHDGDAREALRAAGERDPDPASWSHRGLPRDVQAILDRGLERNPAARYRDARELGADLRAFLEHRPVSARPHSGLVRTLRRWRSQPARTAAALAGVAVIAFVAIVLPLAGIAQANARRAERAELLAALPADAGIEGLPAERARLPAAERERLLRDLDRLVALEPADLHARLLRAAERFDAGDPAGGRADVDAIAAAAPSPFLAALAARHAAAKPSAFDLADLPEPRTAADCFVAGFLALRGGRPEDAARADELLGRCPPEYLPARELRLFAALGRETPDPLRVVDEATWLERRHGRPTARTREALAAAALARGEWAKAIPLCHEALALRPEGHGPLDDLGFAHLRLGDLAEAKRWLGRAAAARPWSAPTRGRLCRTLRELGELDAARAEAERIEDECWREHELATIALLEAIAATRGGDDARRSERAREAADRFAAVERLGAAGAETRLPPRRRDGASTGVAFARALAEDADLLRGTAAGASGANGESSSDALRAFLFDLGLAVGPDERLPR